MAGEEKSGRFAADKERGIFGAFALEAEVEEEEEVVEVVPEMSNC
jgi:hypothetical protein